MVAQIHAIHLEGIGKYLGMLAPVALVAKQAMQDY